MTGFANHAITTATSDRANVTDPMRCVPPCSSWVRRIRRRTHQIGTANTANMERN